MHGWFDIPSNRLFLLCLLYFASTFISTFFLIHLLKYFSLSISRHTFSLPLLLDLFPSPCVSFFGGGANPCSSRSRRSSLTICFISGVQSVCSQASSSRSLSFGVLSGKKRCLIRHGGTVPRPVFFFFVKTNQSLCSTPPFWETARPSFVWSFFNICSTPVKDISWIREPEKCHPDNWIGFQ